jgi:hypothetical protein
MPFGLSAPGGRQSMRAPRPGAAVEQPCGTNHGTLGSPAIAAWRREKPPAYLESPTETTGNPPAWAMSRMSSVIFIEQYFGPHMLQKWALLKVS